MADLMPLPTLMSIILLHALLANNINMEDNNNQRAKKSQWFDQDKQTYQQGVIH